MVRNLIDGDVEPNSTIAPKALPETKCGGKRLDGIGQLEKQYRTERQPQAEIIDAKYQQGDRHDERPDSARNEKQDAREKDIAGPHCPIGVRRYDNLGS